MSTEPSQLIVRDLRAAATDEKPLTLQPPGTPLSEEAVLLQVVSRAAANPNFDLDRVERLLQMQRELAAQRAEREFVDAMAEFKRDAKVIVKNRRVSFGQTNYTHASLGQVCQAAIEGLAKVGISHRWDLKQEGNRIEVTCVLTHRGGHSSRTTLSGAPDNSGQKNSIQQVASTVTYLERYTLLAATGLATEDQDDDGRGAGAQKAGANGEQKKPEGFDNWWADTTAAADNGVAVLERCWSNAPKGCRAYVTKNMPAAWETLKQIASQVTA